MLEGAFRHEDNKGHAGTIGVGDLQWMTAGRGIVHSEMPATDGRNVGLQLWVNLAAAKKMTKPQYQGKFFPVERLILVCAKDLLSSTFCCGALTLPCDVQNYWLRTCLSQKARTV